MLDLYRERFPKAPEPTGLPWLWEQLQGDVRLSDNRWTAYILATVKHETANTFRPIAEYGRGKGRSYGQPDPETGQIYYGRGYVQLTWRRNYQLFASLLDVDLVNDPDAAMQQDTAYEIMLIGMTRGKFTGKKLGDYLNDEKSDFVNARRIINGLDRAFLIASYAEMFLSMIDGKDAQA